MSGFTKWITGSLGFVLGGPIGAIVGFALGAIIDSAEITTHTFDNRYNGRFEKMFGGYRYQKTYKDNSKISLLVLIACVMKADGSPKKKELAVVKRFLLLNFVEQEALEMLQILKNILQQDIDELQVSRQIGSSMNYSSKLELIHFLLEIAYSDGGSEQELLVIQRISKNIGVSRFDLESLQALYYGKKSDPDWAFRALDIKQNATNKEIKKAYRIMAKKYHPDTIANLDKELQTEGNDQFRIINEAYEQLKKQRGMK